MGNQQAVYTPASPTPVGYNKAGKPVYSCKPICTTPQCQPATPVRPVAQCPPRVVTAPPAMPCRPAFAPAVPVVAPMMAAQSYPEISPAWPRQPAASMQPGYGMQGQQPPQQFQQQQPQQFQQQPQQQYQQQQPQQYQQQPPQQSPTAYAIVDTSTLGGSDIQQLSLGGLGGQVIPINLGQSGSSAQVINLSQLGLGGSNANGYSLGGLNLNGINLDSLNLGSGGNNGFNVISLGQGGGATPLNLDLSTLQALGLGIGQNNGLNNAIFTLAD